MSGLLQRIHSGQAGPRRSEDALGAIAAHLRILLNSRQGDAAALPSFGILDFSQLVHAPQSSLVLAASIRDSILEHEPRLKQVVVRHLESSDPLVLRFEITGRLEDRSAREVLRFTTQVSPGGRVELE